MLQPHLINIRDCLRLHTIGEDTSKFSLLSLSLYPFGACQNSN